MPDHDPVRFANGLSTKLAARSRHVCILLGAGASKACGLPDVAMLQTLVTDGLDGDQRKAFESELTGRNLEQALSRLRQIASLVEGGETVDGLTSEAARTLDAEVCRLMIEELGVEDADLTPVLRLAAWIARADYQAPLEVFTVNYDLLLETALEELGVAYFDGFVGSLRARFRTDLVEARPGDDPSWLPSFVARVWKLHGSVNWLWEGDELTDVVRIGSPVVAGSPAAIYPSDTKYAESRRVPFVVLQDRLRRALREPETLFLVAGYSWGDQHLNDVLFDAATRRPRSEFVAFCHSSIPAGLADHAAITPNLQVVTRNEAVLGGLRGDWSLPDPLPTEDIWQAGEFAMRDFGNLAAFLPEVRHHTANSKHGWRNFWPRQRASGWLSRTPRVSDAFDRCSDRKSRLSLTMI